MALRVDRQALELHRGQLERRNRQLDAARQRQRRGFATARVELHATDVELEDVLDVGGEDVARLRGPGFGIGNIVLELARGRLRDRGEAAAAVQADVEADDFFEIGREDAARDLASHERTLFELDSDLLERAVEAAEFGHQHAFEGAAVAGLRVPRQVIVSPVHRAAESRGANEHVVHGHVANAEAGELDLGVVEGEAGESRWSVSRQVRRSWCDPAGRSYGEDDSTRPDHAARDTESGGAVDCKMPIGVERHTHGAKPDVKSGFGRVDLVRPGLHRLQIFRAHAQREIQ